MKYLLYSYVIIGLLFVAQAPVFAQEEGVSVEENIVAETTSEEVTEEEVINEESEEEITELSSEEIENILEDAEVLGEEDLESFEDLEGEILAVTSDEFILETEAGEVIVVEKAVYESFVTISTGTRKIQTGDSLKLGTLSLSDEGTHVLTSQGSYAIASDTPVRRNGKKASLSDIEEGSSVAVILDASDEVVGLELMGDTEDADFPFGIVIIIILAIVIALKMRKKKAE